MDWVLGRATHRSMCGTAIGADTFSDLDYADDVALLAELFEPRFITFYTGDL